MATNKAINLGRYSFFALPGASINNVTGDGTDYTCVMNTAYVNQNNCYDTATGIFTSKKSGNYMFCCNIMLNNLGAGHNNELISIVKNATVYTLSRFNPSLLRSGGSLVDFAGSIILPLAIGDTVACMVNVSGSTKTVSLYASLFTSFSGAMIV